MTTAPTLRHEILGIGIKCLQWTAHMPPEQWAEQVYRLPNGQRFRWDYAPFARGMFSAIWDKRAREVVYQCFSRGFKTTCTLLAAGYSIDQAPRRILWMWQTVGHAEKFSKEGLGGELFDTTTALNYLSAGNRRLSSNTITFKRYPGGSLNLFGANAPGELRRAKGNLLIADEIDAYEQTLTDEGDILLIFDKRGAEFPDTINIKCSYPSLTGHSRIQSLLNASDYNEWHVTCVLCGGQPFVMHRSQLRYDEDKPERARLECPRCHGLLDDTQRYAMAHGQGYDNWKPRNEFRGRHGFHANSLLWPHRIDEAHKYPGGYLQVLAMEEIEAKNAPDPRRALRVLVNTRDAEPFDPTEESEQAPDWKRLFDAREPYGDRTKLVVPRPVVLASCFIDVQNNRLELEWKGWARDEQSWGLAYTVLDGNPLDIQPGSVWHRAIKELERTFTREDGAVLRLNMCFVDGGKWGDWAYAFYRLVCQTDTPIRGKVLLSKGVGRHGEPINCRKMSSIHRNIKGIPIGVWAAKDLVYARLRLQRNDDGTFPPGYMHHPLTYDENHFQQLTSDHVLLDFVAGEEVRKYGNNEGKRDEALDTAVGNLAVFKLRPWNFDALDAALLETIPKQPDPDKPAQPVAKKPFFSDLGGMRF